ncbi:MAG: TRAP transporter small permease [Loktanella sp.]|nr:TRAP transporter small permease [Loktanella sp.]
MINRILEGFIAVLLVAAVGVAFLAVIYRYALNSALSWSFEVSLALLTYITFIGGYLALRKGAHLKVDLLLACLPFPMRGAAFLLNQALIGLIGWIMAWYGTRQMLRFSDQHTNVLEVSNSWYYAAIPIAGGLICIDVVTTTIRGLIRMFRGEEPVSSDSKHSSTSIDL